MSKGISPVVFVFVRRALVLGCTAAAIVLPLGSARSAAASAATAAPVSSLQPAATARLWHDLVRRPQSASQTTDCRPLRAVFYARTDWLRLATKLAANVDPCGQYYISIPPLAGNKTTFRGDQAWRIRALGPNFHALAEFNYTGWTSWVAANGGSWFNAGVEARRRMAQAGYDVNAGDTWALNEISSAVRRSGGDARQAVRDLTRGLYQGDGSLPAVKGVVFITGIGSGTTSLATYKVNLQNWMQDSAFWTDMSAYVSDWSQEVYGNARTYAVENATLEQRRDSLNSYLEHGLTLATAAPDQAAAARSFLQSAYSPLANAAWRWNASFGWTDIPYEQMEDYVSAQTYAMRWFAATTSQGVDHFGFAWAPQNLGLPRADFGKQSSAVVDRLAAAIHDSGQPVDPADPGIGACGPAGQNLWCSAAIDGAALNTKWKTFASWSLTALVFTTPPVTVSVGVASPPISIQLQLLGFVQADTLPVTVTLTSSSPQGLFATSLTDPWTNTLDLTIPPGSTSATFYYQDTTAGTATITASAPQHISGTQTVTIGASSVTAIGISPESASLLLGDTQTFTAQGKDVFGNPVAPVVNWSLSPGTPGTLSTLSGTSTTYTSDPQETGSGSIIATFTTDSGTLTATAPIVVSPRPLQISSIRYAPAKKHLMLTIMVTSKGKPVASASVRGTLYRDQSPVVPMRGQTGAAGKTTFTILPRAAGGCYQIKINGVTAIGHSWDGATPTNRYCWRPPPKAKIIKKAHAARKRHR